MEQLLQLLQQRFQQFPERHENIAWEIVERTLLEKADVLQAVSQMEETGGEPDVVELEKGVFYFVDCAIETPKARRSVCYDDAALASRKQHKPQASAQRLAEQMGVTILSEQQYRTLQTFGAFDLKTSSWVQTPEEIRQLGGTLFCDRRYNTVFVYHNGAESYYSSRAFRSCIQL